jgi:hypothetical protein
MGTPAWDNNNAGARAGIKTAAYDEGLAAVPEVKPGGKAYTALAVIDWNMG